MTARITINPALKHSKAGIALQRRRPGSTEPAVFILNLPLIKEGLSGRQLSGTGLKSQTTDTRVIQSELNKTEQTGPSAQGNARNQFCVSSA